MQAFDNVGLTLLLSDQFYPEYFGWIWSCVVIFSEQSNCLTTLCGSIYDTMLGGNSLVFFSIWEHTEGVCPWVRHTHYTLETGFIRKLAQNFGNSFWRVKHKHAPGLWLSGLQRADFIIFTRQPGLSWACTTASWVLQLVSTSREANKRNKTSHSEGGKKSIPESEWLHGGAETHIGKSDHETFPCQRCSAKL